MKTLLKRLIPAVLLFVLLGTSAYAQNKIATVDLGKVFTNYWKTQKAQVQIEGQKADMDKQYKEMMEAYRKAKEDYQKLETDARDQAVSAEERDRRKKATETKLKDLKEQEEGIMQFDRSARARLEEQLRRTRENIIGEIRVAVNAKAKTSGFSMVLDTAGQSISGTPVLLFSAGDNDITEAVLKQINTTAPSDDVDEKKPVRK